MTTVTALRQKRAAAVGKMEALVAKDSLTPEEKTQFDTLEREAKDADEAIDRAERAQTAAAATARPVAGQETHVRVEAAPDPYTDNEYAKRRGWGSARSLVIGGIVRAVVRSGGNVYLGRQVAQEIYGESHPVTRALVTSVGASGGFIVPPEYMNEIIELLRPKAVVRGSGPRVIPMPRGTMTLPGQKTAATASYGSETKQIASSQQTLNQIVASYKKLTALVPVSNDMMRYADPAVDAFVRDDLVKVIAIREDLAFLLGDGTQDTPRGFLSFANGWVQANGGTVGVWNTGANSTLAVNGADPANSTGGNFITSNATYTLATAAQELGGAVNRLDTANVPDMSRVWFMHPRSYNYLFNVQNSLGVYVYREELLTGKLLGYPVKKSTQIGTNYWDASGTNKDLSFIFLAEMDEAMILDSMSLELAVSREGMYVDATTSATISAFQNDQTLIRAIAEHDFQIRHDQSVSVIQGVRWAPAIS